MDFKSKIKAKNTSISTGCEGGEVVEDMSPGADGRLTARDTSCLCEF